MKAKDLHSLQKAIVQRQRSLLSQERKSLSESARIAEQQRRVLRAKARYETGGFCHIAATGSASGRRRVV
ncbi:hypothetical protein [Endozoicomonas sp. ALC066]|uniref:hypothetical protein n=1 Tax=Endozoicomonas sp. ALC066 TaxID=3403078 RepID=UPI003BB68E0E